MSTTKPSSVQHEGTALDYQQAGPTVPRMLLGAQLRRLREACNITREQAGEAIWGSHSKIGRLELGRTGFKLRDVSDLLALYGVTDESERATLLALAKQANQRAWWHPYSDVVPPWLHSYLGLEAVASVIRTYEVQFVPGLLQTADYARAVIRLGHDDEPQETIARRVDLRMRRQEILHRPNPPHLWAVIDEAALRRTMGTSDVMRGQVRHLLEVAKHRSVTIQVMPFARGGHAAAGGAISYLRMPETLLPDVVYLEQLTSALYPDRPADIERYQHVMNALAVQAERPDESVRTLERILREI